MSLRWNRLSKFENIYLVKRSEISTFRHMILECRNGREHYQFDLQSTDSFHCSKVGITKIIKSKRNSLPLWELIFWRPFLFSMSFGYLPMILISEWFIIFSLFLVQKSCRNLKRGRYGRLGLFDEKLISWRLKDIFKFTMHGSLKAWEGYPRWLERIEQRITDLDIYLKASAKGIRRKKGAFTCLGPRGIFMFTMHVYLWS